MPDVAPTRSAAMALAEERMLMRQGFGFLDEKRMLLAGEMLRQLRRYEALSEEASSLRSAARDTLVAAVERHGLDALQLYPPPEQAPKPPQIAFAKFLGVRMKVCAAWRIAGLERSDHSPPPSIPRAKPSIAARLSSAGRKFCSKPA